MGDAEEFWRHICRSRVTRFWCQRPVPRGPDQRPASIRMGEFFNNYWEAKVWALSAIDLPERVTPIDGVKFIRIVANEQDHDTPFTVGMISSPTKKLENS